MRNDSHNTLIGTVRAAVIEWRKREGWSRESVVQEIVDAHERIGGPAITDIAFDPNTRDHFQRLKVNADRVFRWLDDESKDTNLLPVNFLPSILAALPADLQFSVLSAVARPLGYEIRSAKRIGDAEFNPQEHAINITKETAEATIAMLSIGPDASAADREKVKKELADARQVIDKAMMSADAWSVK